LWASILSFSSCNKLLFWGVLGGEYYANASAIAIAVLAKHVLAR